MKDCLDGYELQNYFNNEVVVVDVNVTDPWAQDHTGREAQKVYLKSGMAAKVFQCKVWVTYMKKSKV